MKKEWNTPVIEKVLVQKITLGGSPSGSETTTSAGNGKKNPTNG